ncbi:hypothetical protein DFH07DRAFT_509436 [Mycena maculata]|uniref:Uncharacterized protein n=1 Tax=Mycena maculata TaxID=230809 RepID=A0AAD7K6R3_9AGAR|nr:hypothetical protein DFH07DRAFT_509436 [Mycena maculata]
MGWGRRYARRGGEQKWNGQAGQMKTKSADADGIHDSTRRRAQMQTAHTTRQNESRRARHGPPKRRTWFPLLSFAVPSFLSWFPPPPSYVFYLILPFPRFSAPYVSSYSRSAYIFRSLGLHISLPRSAWPTYFSSRSRMRNQGCSALVQLQPRRLNHKRLGAIATNRHSLPDLAIGGGPSRLGDRRWTEPAVRDVGAGHVRRRRSSVWQGTSTSAGRPADVGQDQVHGVPKTLPLRPVVAPPDSRPLARHVAQSPRMTLTGRWAF